MDTKALVSEAKARFSHSSAKAYLRDKYDSKLFVADQGGLWKADLQTISFLHACPHKEIVLVDTFNNPVKVDRSSLVLKLGETYTDVMNQYYNEFKELENNR